MIQKRFELIDKSDIDALVANAVSEGKTIDYKETLPGNSDGDKKEFLKDISSFANASGGDVIYGIQEKRDASGKATGLPDAAKGLAGVNIDQETLRLDNVIRNGIAPRIGGVQIKGIAGFPDGPVIVIRVPKSWAAPHMITFQSESRFFSRTNAGKYPLDVTEIRSAFALSETLPEKVRRFREERIARIVADETPVPLAHSSRTVLHILPIASLDPTYLINLGKVADPRRRLRPMGASGWSSRYNFDGFVTYDGDMNAPSLGYVQVFRNGTIEAVESALLAHRNQHGIGIIENVRFEDRLINALTAYLNEAQSWGIEPPYFVMLTLIGVRNFVITNRVDWSDGLHPIDRDTLMLPDILIEEGLSNVGAVLRPAFDALWQASGLSGSWNYDQDGNWKARVH